MEFGWWGMEKARDPMTNGYCGIRKHTVLVKHWSKVCCVMGWVWETARVCVCSRLNAVWKRESRDLLSAPVSLLESCCLLLVAEGNCKEFQSSFHLPWFGCMCTPLHIFLVMVSHGSFCVFFLFYFLFFCFSCINVTCFYRIFRLSTHTCMGWKRCLTLENTSSGAVNTHTLCRWCSGEHTTSLHSLQWACAVNNETFGDDFFFFFCLSGWCVKQFAMSIMKPMRFYTSEYIHSINQRLHTKPL